MLVFLDFEASSLAKAGYPIEVAWVFEDGHGEAHLICPAEGWDDWDEAAQAIHRISPAMLRREGEPVADVAARMLDQLAGHDLVASAPSWDGKWMSVLLRAAGHPRHALRLRDTEAVWAEAARRILAPVVPAAELDDEVESLLTLAEMRHRNTPVHRALADAEEERRRWLAICDAAHRRAAELAKVCDQPDPFLPSEVEAHRPSVAEGGSA